MQILSKEQFESLPDFLKIEVIDGMLYTDDWTELVIDDSVFKEGAPSENHHVRYRLIVEQG